MVRVHAGLVLALVVHIPAARNRAILRLIGRDVGIYPLLPGRVIETAIAPTITPAFPLQTIGAHISISEYCAGFLGAGWSGGAGAAAVGAGRAIGAMGGVAVAGRPTVPGAGAAL